MSRCPWEQWLHSGVVGGAGRWGQGPSSDCETVILCKSTHWSGNIPPSWDRCQCTAGEWGQNKKWASSAYLYQGESGCWVTGADAATPTDWWENYSHKCSLRRLKWYATFYCKHWSFQVYAWSLLSLQRRGVTTPIDSESEEVRRVTELLMVLNSSGSIVKLHSFFSEARLAVTDSIKAIYNFNFSFHQCRTF